MFTAALAPPTLESGVQHGVYLPGLQIAAICLVLMLLVALPAIASWRRAWGRRVLEPAAVESLLLGAGALVVDLRNAKEFRTGHIRGCLQVPFRTSPPSSWRPIPRKLGRSSWWMRRTPSPTGPTTSWSGGASVAST